MEGIKKGNEATRKAFEQHLLENDLAPLSRLEKLSIDCFIDFANNFFIKKETKRKFIVMRKAARKPKTHELIIEAMHEAQRLAFKESDKFYVYEIVGKVSDPKNPT